MVYYVARDLWRTCEFACCPIDRSLLHRDRPPPLLQYRSRNLSFQDSQAHSISPSKGQVPSQSCGFSIGKFHDPKPCSLVVDLATGVSSLHIPFVSILHAQRAPIARTSTIPLFDKPRIPQCLYKTWSKTKKPPVLPDLRLSPDLRSHTIPTTAIIECARHERTATQVERT